MTVDRIGSRDFEPTTHDRRDGRGRPPIEPLKRAFTLRFHTSAQLDRIKQATLDILETVGVRFPSVRALDMLAEHGCPSTTSTRWSRSRPSSCSSAMAKAPRYFDLGARDPSCAFSICRRHDLLHERRLRRRDRRLRLGRQAALDQGRPGARHASYRLPLVDRVLVAHHLGRRLRRDRPAPRARRRLEQHGQAPAGHGQRGARGALRRRDGDGHRRQRRRAAPPAGALRPDRHHLAARAGRGRHRGGPGVRRGRRAGHFRHHAHAGHDRAGHARRRLRRGRRRTGERHRARCSSPFRARRWPTPSCRAMPTRAPAPS